MGHDCEVWYHSQNRISPQMLYGSPNLGATAILAAQPAPKRTEAYSRALEAPSRPNSPVSDQALTPLHILAVDDNTIILKLLHRYLVKAGSNIVTTAYSGAEAVAAVHNAKAGQHFNVIFMDISMPDMDGYEATTVIRSLECSSTGSSELGERRKNKAYIVALTGLTSQKHQDAAEKGGFDEYWTKPVSFSRIRDLLRRLHSLSMAANL